jgi:hypothetical protein
MSIVALIIAPHINVNVNRNIPHAEITPQVNVERTVEISAANRL